MMVEPDFEIPGSSVIDPRIGHGDSGVTPWVQYDILVQQGLQIDPAVS
jgi:hypothetical protein